MRYSDVVRRVRPVPDQDLLLVGPKHLEQLRALAESTAEAAKEGAGFTDMHAWGYADGVAGLLDWLLGETPTTELAELLELEV